MKKMLLVTFAILFNLVSFCHALETDTHEIINEYIARNSSNGFSLNLYLKDQLNIYEGIEESFNSNKIWWWLRKGGKLEDKPPGTIPYLRSVNHFHNPLTDKGFSGIWGTGFLAGDSSIQWSQKPTGAQSPGGHYSWYDVRGYFHKALTDTNKTTREKNFADTFRGLGQLMHLVQDLSVPAHTRDDGHVLYNYEKWVLANIEDDKGIAKYSPIYFDPFLIGASNTLAPVPVANLFDTNQYNGVNPEITKKSDIGLSEYTNANFLTEDTMWEYPHPSLNETNYNASIWLNPEQVDAEDGEQDNRIYFSKNTGEPIDHLMAAGYWYYQLYMWNAPELKHAFILDDKCYADYASKLIPRAVGYSAGLLDYFFRGKIEISLPDSGVYALIEPSDPPAHDFSRITLLAGNISAEGEDMTDGSIELVVKYKIALNDPFINYGYPVPTSSEFFYIVAPEANSTRSIPREPVELAFDLSNLPLWATDVYLQVIYKGKLGLEDQAVAVGFKDICEPTFIDFFNNMDKTCINNTWYNSGSPEAIALADKDNNGIADTNEWDVYSHDLKNIFFTFLSPDDIHYPSCTVEDDIHIPYLAAGNYHRVFVLSDYNFCFSFCAFPIVHTNADDLWGFNYFPPSTYCATGIKNQRELSEIDPSIYIRHYPIFSSFRGVDMWTGFIFKNTSFPEKSSCSLELLE